MLIGRRGTRGAVLASKANTAPPNGVHDVAETQEASPTLVETAELQAIRCVRLQAELTDRANAGSVTPSQVRVAIKSGTSEPPGALFFQFDYEVELESSGGETVARVSCAYEATFAIPPDSAWGVEATRAFASTIVVFAVHPYVREAVSSVCARMNLAVEPMGLLVAPFDETA
jgi:hypothetical protein